MTGAHPLESAQRLVASIQGRGGVFHVKPDGSFRLDLDPIADMTAHDADAIATAVLGLRSQIRLVLAADQLAH